MERFADAPARELSKRMAFLLHRARSGYRQAFRSYLPSRQVCGGRSGEGGSGRERRTEYAPTSRRMRSLPFSGLPALQEPRFAPSLSRMAFDQGTCAAVPMPSFKIRLAMIFSDPYRSQPIAEPRHPAASESRTTCKDGSTILPCSRRRPSPSSPGRCSSHKAHAIA